MSSSEEEGELNELASLQAQDHADDAEVEALLMSSKSVSARPIVTEEGTVNEEGHAQDQEDEDEKKKIKIEQIDEEAALHGMRIEMVQLSSDEQAGLVRLLREEYPTWDWQILPA